MNTTTRTITITIPNEYDGRKGITSSQVINDVIDVITMEIEEKNPGYDVIADFGNHVNVFIECLDDRYSERECHAIEQDIWKECMSIVMDNLEVAEELGTQLNNLP